MQVNVEDAIEALKRHRGKFLTQSAAADDLGISESYYSYLLNGERDFSPKILKKLGLSRIKFNVIVKPENPRPWK